MSALDAGYERLKGEWRNLESQWAITRQQWSDSVGDYFERAFWREWEAEVPEALKAMAELEHVLRLALRDPR
ncbi:hypothetical protein [Limisphaera sp. VF-2]|uniref:hypothetical protein n=1 Tax=Limisphaera sp. VF-2 TaxID=3400418 RepID=UPI003C13AC06